MGARFILRGVGVLALAFVLTSAAMFWLPFFKRVIDYDVYDYIDTYWDMTETPDRTRSYQDYSVRELRKLSPVEERKVVDKILPELNEKTDAELLKLNGYADICLIDLVDCRGLPSATVKPFVEATRLGRQNAETSLYARTANFISAGSLFVSFVALILAYRRTRAIKEAGQ